MNQRARGVAEMSSAMVISGTVGWFVVMSGEPAWSVVFWRCACGAAALLAICLMTGLLRSPWQIGRAQLALAVIGGVALAANWVLLFGAYSRASISIATVVYHTQPFILVAIGTLVFRERLTTSKVGWLLVAFAGMAVIVMSKPQSDAAGSAYLLGVAMALGAAMLYAVAAAITKQLKGVSPYLLVTIQLIVGTVALAPFATTEVPSDPGTWGYLATIGVLHTGIMSVLLYGAIQKIPTALVGALAFIYPVVSILVDWVAFDYRLSATQILGAFAILIAVAGDRKSVV